MAPKATITVQVVYARSKMQTLVELTVPAGTTAGAAVAQGAKQSGFVLSSEMRVGIYGRVVAADTILREGDRVEIYRPLIADAKQARRRRAARTP
jgi:putative ubiquitin-RnfH superfamily antitoxin RatB of RatAB toxin-antitoxin module